MHTLKCDEGHITIGVFGKYNNIEFNTNSMKSITKIAQPQQKHQQQSSQDVYPIMSHSVSSSSGVPFSGEKISAPSGPLQPPLDLHSLLTALIFPKILSTFDLVKHWNWTPTLSYHYLRSSYYKTIIASIQQWYHSLQVFTSTTTPFGT
ncbi:unnamed protein product [Absidia cylindrospora]